MSSSGMLQSHPLKRGGRQAKAAQRRLLVTGAGTGATNNLIRSLKAGAPALFIVGCHSDRFFLKKSMADRNYLVPRFGHSKWAQALRYVLKAERIDLLIPSTDLDVKAVSSIRDKLRDQVFLPRQAVVELCQDKYLLSQFLRGRGLPAPATIPVTDLKHLASIFRRLGRTPVWCRIRTGSGSMGAMPVRSPGQARSWIRSWEAERRVPATSFTLSEYLPGRDFGCQSLWNKGELILIKAYERLSYLLTGGQLSQVSSVAALSKTVYEPRVAEICANAVRALDGKASGAFSVDLKEDASGAPRITEINAGRLSSATNILDLTGKHNMAVTYVQLALGEPVDIPETYDLAGDYYMLRDFDSCPRIFHADEFFDEIAEPSR
jgi:glutathione synthase/RimK-type ligase-like ATP-grasp enzyme